MKALAVFLLPIFFLLLRIHGLSKGTKKGNSEVQEPHLEETLDLTDLLGGGRFERDVTTESEEHEYEDEKLKTAKKLDFKNTEYTVTKNKDNEDLKIPEGYSVYEIPKDPMGSPMPLFLNLNIKKVLDFDELEEILKLDMEFKVMWTDFKILYFNNKSLSRNSTIIPTIDDLTPEEIRRKRKVLNNPYILEKIWKPNLFIENLLAVRQPAIMARPLTVKFIPEVGWFEYITRISVKLDCGMDFNYYPADTQSCDFSIRGFSYVKKDLNLNWHKHGVFLEDTTLPSFDMKVDDLSRTEWHKTNEPDEVFDLLSFKILARRKLSYHLVQTYLASTFYIIITCLCFLLPSKMVEARIGISMTTLLTLTSMFASVRESTPIASYVKAIDIWMVGCIFFVFLTLSQFTFHIWLRNAKEEYFEEQKRKYELKYPKDTFEIDDTSNVARRKSENPSQHLLQRFRRYEITAEYLDSFSFPLFLCIFAVYTIIYWTWLMNSSGYYNWSVNNTWNNLEHPD